jgi:hypothetical protein
VIGSGDGSGSDRVRKLIRHRRFAVKSKACSCAYVVAVLLVEPALATVEIDTMASWDGATSVVGFGEPDTSYFGQSFVALDERIRSISFVLDGMDWDGAPYPTEFHLLVTPLAPTNDRPDFDAILFESGDLSTTLGSDFEVFEVETNVSVSPGSRYMWILDALVLQDDEHGIARMGLIPGSYDEGEFLFWNTGPFEPGPRSEHDDFPWDTWEPDSDAAFRAVFVPEGTSIWLLVLLTPIVGRRSLTVRRGGFLQRKRAVVSQGGRTP